MTLKQFKELIENYPDHLLVDFILYEDEDIELDKIHMEFGKLIIYLTPG